MPPLPCPPPRGHSPRSWHNVPPPLGSLCLSLMPLLRCCVLASLDLHPSGPHPHLTWAGCHAAPSQARPTSPHCKVWRPGLVVPRLPTRRRDGVGYPSPGPGPPSVHLDFRPLILPPPAHQASSTPPSVVFSPPHCPSRLPTSHRSRGSRRGPGRPSAPQRSPSQRGCLASEMAASAAAPGSLPPAATWYPLQCCHGNQGWL